MDEAILLKMEIFKSEKYLYNVIANFLLCARLLFRKLLRKMNEGDLTENGNAQSWKMCCIAKKRFVSESCRSLQLQI